MKYIFKDKTNYYDKKLTEPTRGMKTYFPHIRCYRNIVCTERAFWYIFIPLLLYATFKIHQTEPESWLVFGLFAGILLYFFTYIVVGGLFPSGTDNVIACIQVDFFHQTPHHIAQYFPLSISILTFGGQLSKKKEKTLCECLWIYHLANKKLTWHFFVLRSISNYLFLNLFIFLFFIERSLLPNINKSFLPYYLIAASIAVAAATACKLSKIHSLIIKELPKSLAKLGPMRYVVRVPDKLVHREITDDIFYDDFVRATYKVDRMGTYMLFMQLIVSVCIAIITTYLRGGAV